MEIERLNALLINRLMLKSNIHILDYKSMDTLSNVLKTVYNIQISPTTLSRLSGLRKNNNTKKKQAPKPAVSPPAINNNSF